MWDWLIKYLFNYPVRYLTTRALSQQNIHPMMPLTLSVKVFTENAHSGLEIPMLFQDSREREYLEIPMLFQNYTEGEREFWRKK